MVKEELTSHEVEGEVVETPSHEEESTEGVVFDDFCYSKNEQVVARMDMGDLLLSKSR